MAKLVIEHLSKYYRQNDIQIKALDDVSVSIDDNQIVGLVGQNGSGKTTFIKSCTNLLTYEGEIRWANDGKKRKLCYKDYSAVLEGNRNIYWKLTAVENIRYFAGLRGIKFNDIKELSFELLNALYLYEKKDCLVETLSRGMKQKTALVCALVLGTPIVFLDEPTLGLDIESRNHLKDFFINDFRFIKDRLIFITSHDLNFIRDIASRQLFIKQGKVYDTNLSDYNPNIYKIETETAQEQSANFPHGLMFENDSFFIDTNIISLSEGIGILESNGIRISSVTKLSNDIESYYLDFIKKH